MTLLPPKTSATGETPRSVTVTGVGTRGAAASATLGAPAKGPAVAGREVGTARRRTTPVNPRTPAAARGTAVEHRGQRRGARRRAVPVALGLAGALLLRAGPVQAGDYWLSAELEGSANTRSAAVTAMSPDGAETPSTPPPLAGHVVGKTASLSAALAWVERWAFSGEALPPHGSRALHLGPAPVPGGELVAGFGTYLLALVIDEVDADGGTQGFRWPKPAPELPERWVPAAIMSQRAPLFAAPSPLLPPFAESHDTALRSDDVYLLGVVDRCRVVDGTRRCLRWGQVLVHGHGRWRGGYLPLAQVATMDEWVRAPAGLPRVHAVRSATDGDDALVLLMIRTRDYELHRTVLRVPLAGDAFPELEVSLEAAEAVVTVGGEEVARRPLTASVDARR